MSMATLRRVTTPGKTTYTAVASDGRKVRITESSGMPDMASAMSNFFDGRYPPYGHGWERAVGSTLSVQLRTHGVTMREVVIATERTGRQLDVILGGLYDRGRLDDGEIGRVARVVGVDMRTLRRIGDDADGVRPRSRERKNDPGYVAMFRMAHRDSTYNSEEYRESVLVGAGVKSTRERLRATRKWLSQRSGTPVEFIKLLERGLVPSRLMDSQGLADVLAALGVDRRGIALIGAAARSLETRIP